MIGGALAPRGADQARSGRQTHSPTTFLRDLGAAYRKSRRTTPIMDALVIHPYGETSKTPPTALHPKSTSISIADYPKLVRLLRDAFPGHGAARSLAADPLRRVRRPDPDPRRQASAPTRTSGVPSATDAVSQTMQAAYYKQAIQLAYCQPTVSGLLFFHVSDEPDLDRWQSGLFYADDTPKSSLEAVATAAQAAQAGTLTCPEGETKATAAAALALAA